MQIWPNFKNAIFERIITFKQINQHLFANYCLTTRTTWTSHLWYATSILSILINHIGYMGWVVCQFQSNRIYCRTCLISFERWRNSFLLNDDNIDCFSLYQTNISLLIQSECFHVTTFCDRFRSRLIKTLAINYERFFYLKYQTNSNYTQFVNWSDRTFIDRWSYIIKMYAVWLVAQMGYSFHHLKSVTNIKSM